MASYSSRICEPAVQVQAILVSREATASTLMKAAAESQAVRQVVRVKELARVRGHVTGTGTGTDTDTDTETDTGTDTDL
jgi:hypothetical protein